MITPPKEKSVSAVNRDAQRDEANVTHSLSVKALLEFELDENLTALLVAIALIVMSCN